MITAEIKLCLRPGSGVNIIVTAGNRWRMDDGVGPYISSELRSSDVLIVINAACRPENIVDKIISLNPAYIIFIDAADFGGKPGEARVLEASDISTCSISTHSIPIPVIAQIIHEEIRTEIRYIGIQLEKYSFGEGLSEAVLACADEIVDEIRKNFI